jgi:hypothetical protein
MSSHKRASGASEIYSNHLFGKGFNNNPANTRTGTIERMYHRILTELATNRFKWDGLPDSIDVRFLEMKLFYKALAVFYFDKEYDQYLALDGTGTSYVNMLDNPTAFQVIGNHFVGKTISAKNCVPIWANYVRMPDIDIVQIYSHKLANLDRSVEINSANARQTKVIVSSENQRLTTTNISRQIDEGVNNIAVAGAMQDLAFIQALDLGVNPDTIEKLHIVRTRLWNECMGLMGLENSNQDKTERLVSGEADANNDQTSAMRYVNLNARRIAATAINKKYPELNVSVRYYTDEERNASMDIAPVTDNAIDDGVDE